MDLLMAILLTVLYLLIWGLCGFIAFLIEAKKERWDKFDKVAQDKLYYCIIFGILSLIIMSCCKLSDNFNDFMNQLLWKINHKNENKTDI